MIVYICILGTIFSKEQVLIKCLLRLAKPVMDKLKNYLGFPGGSVVKNPPANAGHLGSTPGSGRSLGEGNGNPLQYSCLENPMDRGAWQAIVHRVAESDTTEAT